MKNKELEWLYEQLKSMGNRVSIAMALTNKKENLPYLHTILEDMLEKMQEIVDDHCVVKVGK